MRRPTPTWFFVLMVVRLGHRFLLVRERKHGQQWYLPAGRVEQGESLNEAAIRETLEEAGIPIRLDGVLRVEHTPRHDGTCRVRVFFVASPVDDTPPKKEPDDHTLEAGWFSLAELDGMELRGEEVLQAIDYVASGGAAYPMSLVKFELERW